MLAALACLLTLGFSAGASAKTPLDGNGMWIWYLSKSGGNAERVAKKAKAHNVSTVFIKNGDGTNNWSQFTPRLVRNLHRKGLDVCAWHFVYGSKPSGEAQVSAAAKKDGADCLIIDAETSYEGRYAAADKYMTKLRQKVGRGFPLALSGFPYTDYHPSFPYSVFFRRGGVQFNMPQIYWKAIGTTVKAAVGHTYKWNSLYDKQIFPTGQTYDDPGKKQLKAFRKETRSRGARGTNWWSWQETSNGEFRAIGGHVGGSRQGAKIGYPGLHKGSRGDSVVWLQELLKAWGSKLTVDGDFGKRSYSALRSFQRSHGLKRSGRAGKDTWRKLLRRKPEPTNWAHKHGGGHHRLSGPPAPDAPKSAGLPSTPEFPSGTPGHP
jgi:hypothetical protein